MPEMNGYEATAQVRLAPGPNQRVPIIAMTAQAIEGSRHAANPVMHFRRPVQRYSKIIRDAGHGVGIALEQEASGQQRHANALCAQHPAGQVEATGHLPVNAEDQQMAKVRVGFDPLEDAVTESSHEWTLICLRKVRAILPKRVSAMLSQEPWVGVSTYLKRFGRVAK